VTRVFGWVADARTSEAAWQPLRRLQIVVVVVDRHAFGQECTAEVGLAEKKGEEEDVKAAQLRVGQGSTRRQESSRNESEGTKTRRVDTETRRRAYLAVVADENLGRSRGKGKGGRCAWQRFAS